MSERMIELQRAKLGLPPAGSSPSVSMHAMARSPGKGNLQRPQAAANPQTPEEIAATQVLSEDAQIQRFIHRLQRRDDLHPTSHESSGPTVPTALSRRMLQRQGVGYLDDTVAAAVSASADRFLATVLHQAIICRAQRLKGAEMAREAARQRKRHIQHHQADTDDRKRRKAEREEAREKKLLKAIAAAEALKKGGGSSKADLDEKKKKKKKKDDDVSVTNGMTSSAKTHDLEDDGDGDDDDDDDSYDSIDEEEEYYEEKVGYVPDREKGDDEEDDDTLLLKDLVRPLEGWNFHITSKEAVEAQEELLTLDDVDAEDDEGLDNAASQNDENGNEDGVSMGYSESHKSDANSGEEADATPKRKSASSPPPSVS